MSEDDLARGMAAAVLAGDRAAAYALADLLLDCRARGLTPGSVAEECALVRAYFEAGAAYDAAHLDSPWSFDSMKAATRWHDALEAVAAAGTGALARLQAAVAARPPGERYDLISLWEKWEPTVGYRAHAALDVLGVATPAEAAAKGRAAFAGVQGCGPKTLAKIERMLSRHGLKWRGEG